MRIAQRASKKRVASPAEKTQQVLPVLGFTRFNPTYAIGFVRQPGGEGIAILGSSAFKARNDLTHQHNLMYQ
jgi:hypothetical protein